MNLTFETRAPKLETLTFDCLKELKTISKTLIEIEKLKRLKLKPKQHVFPLSLQGANRQAIKMYEKIQENKQGEFPAELVPKDPHDDVIAKENNQSRNDTCNNPIESNDKVNP